MIPPSHPQGLFLSPGAVGLQNRRSEELWGHITLPSLFFFSRLEMCHRGIFKKFSPSWSLGCLREGRRCEGIGTQQDPQCLYLVFFFPLCPLVVGPQLGHRYHFSAKGSLAGCSPSPLCRTLANLRTRPSMWLSSLHSEGRGRGGGGGGQEHQVLTYRISSAATNQDPG